MNKEKRREKKKEYNRKWREKNPEYCKQYYWKNPEKCRAYSRDWGRRHKKHKVKKAMEYQRAHLLEWIHILKKKYGFIGCKICGFNSWKSLHLHHKKGDGNIFRKKYRGTRDFFHYKPTPERIVILDDCELLCANCHSLETWEIDYEIQQIIEG